MSFSTDGVKLNISKMMQNALWRFVVRMSEGVLSVLFVISLAGPMVFPQDANAVAGVSKYLSYQGRLTDTSGNPLGGAGATYYFCFSIYTASSGGTKLWPAGTPTATSTMVTNGVFNLNIGSSGADVLDTYDFASNDTQYLNIEASATSGTCGGAPFETLAPRQQLAAVAYARVAADVYGTALRTSSTRVQAGAGTGQATPIWTRFDNQNTAGVVVGDACPSGSVMGDMWYNSSGTRALMCGVGSTIKGLDNASEISGIKESGAATTVNAGSIVLSNAGGISISQSTATLATNQTNQTIGTFGFSNLNAGGISTMGNTLGTSGVGTGTIFFAGGNNITLSQATGVGARTITIIGPSGGGIAGVSAGTFSASPASLNFSNANGVTFGLNSGANSSVITASVGAGGAGATMSRYMWPPTGGMAALTAPAQGTASIQWVPIYQNVTATRLDVAMSVSLGTSAAANTAGVAISQWAGIFSKNGATLNSIATGSNQQTISWASNTGSYSSIFGIRLFSVPLNVNVTPGDYFIEYHLSTAQSSLGTATTALAPVLSILGNNNLSSLFGTVGVIASNWGLSATSSNVYGGMGVYSAQVGSAFGNISLSAIGQTGLNAAKANIWLQLRNI